MTPLNSGASRAFMVAELDAPVGASHQNHRLRGPVSENTALVDPPSAMLVQALLDAGIDFFVSVPCKLLSGVINQVAASQDVVYSPVTREEEGIGIMAGALMAGRRPAILMQNSGFGNSINAVCSLLNYYRIPATLIMSHRGSAGEPIEAQRMMGAAIKDLMKATGVACFEIPSLTALPVLSREIPAQRAAGRSAGFLFPFSYWQSSK